MGHEPELMDGTLAENIRLGEPGDVAPALRAARLYDEAEAMPEGVNTPVGSGGARLSGGQQARAALARTIYNARGLLVLDDPFSAVDRATEGEIFENLRALAQNRVILLISHRLYAFPKLDGVLFLSGGGGVFSTHAELLRTNPDYAQLCREQSVGEAGA
jgi:ATP-binding cassette subfamily B protein